MASNTSYLKKEEKGIHRLVPVNDGIDDDLDGVGVGQQVSTSRQFHPRYGEAPRSRPGVPAQREKEREIQIEKGIKPSSYIVNTVLPKVMIMLHQGMDSKRKPY